jgi:hypothetical protein
MPNMMKTAEKTLHKKTTKMLAGATRRYNKFMRQATKAASDHKREQYVAALGALVMTGIVASGIKARIQRKKTAPAGNLKKRKTSQGRLKR